MDGGGRKGSDRYDIEPDQSIVRIEHGHDKLLTVWLPSCQDQVLEDRLGLAGIGDATVFAK
jgi:hypothetical protein